MKDLKLPVFKQPDIAPKRLSMTAYARFVEFGYKAMGKRERVLELRLRQEPRARFALDSGS